MPISAAQMRQCKSVMPAMGMIEKGNVFNAFPFFSCFGCQVDCRKRWFAYPAIFDM
jgi:hypothetical protein